MRIPFLVIFSLLATLSFAEMKHVVVDQVAYDIDTEARTAGVAHDDNLNYSGSYVIPDEITYDGEKYVVNEVCKWAFKNQKKLKSVTLGNNILKIGDAAFSGCSKLESFIIPESVTSLGVEAFLDCGIESLTIGGNVSTVGSYCFKGCDCLFNLIINDSEKYLDLPGAFIDSPLEKVYIGRDIYGGSSASGSPFYNKTSLKDVKFGEKVTCIENYLFYGTGLENLVIPKNIIRIYDTVFYTCKSLKSVTFEDGNETLEIGYNSDKNTSTSPDYFASCFYGNPIESVYVGRDLKYSTYSDRGVSPFFRINTIKNVAFGDSITSIPACLFEDCTGLSLVVIPKNITKLGSRAFKGCKIEDVYNYSPTPQAIEETTFDYYGTLHVIKGLYETYHTRNIWKNFSVRDDLSKNVVKSITLSNDTINCKKNDMGKISIVSYEPEDATLDIKWSSDNTNVVLVTSDGTYIAVGYGTAIIIATANDEGGASAQCVINVTQPLARGDIDGDGVVNVSDVTALINSILGTADWPESRCDINGDGQVNVTDVTGLINIILGQ
ncbi:MAG: leucine-rich repeat protein [Muribaculaceae bacterium]|nr:leucine-rich repeat protein [Muribaculaceae bacterium]